MKEKLLIKENLEAVRSKIGVKNVTILAATKTVPADIINYAVTELGITDIGENRVQELLEKYDALEKDKMKIHFIGTLQTNKVKYIIDKVCLIHSVDNIKLAAEIDRQAKKIGRVMDVLVELNIGEEENKSGVMPGGLMPFLDEISGFESIRVKGLMTIGPICANLSEYKKIFVKTYQIFIDILQKKLHNIDNPILSMGMSDSYEAAVECGANMVRLGTALFGIRN